ncbi:hypothetical protein AB0M28_38170, partial [Streptomyces sp. NPDC051940]|uniref:hypothetical protein n=1 Tax=Streptomyces sp. NPDC051940 TaxID=3155675 RepID=UPI003439BC58
MLTGGPVDTAAPAQGGAPGAVQVLGEEHGPGDRDNRKGVLAPTAEQRDAAGDAGARARWNALGTPAALVAAKGPLAGGLPAEPVAAARAWLAGPRAVGGVGGRAAAPR